MSQRRAIETRLALYDDLGGILGAMRSFALAELHRIARREAAQQAVVDALADAWQAVAPWLPAPDRSTRDVWVLIGSVRGFCGSFNEDVAQAWRTHRRAGEPAVCLGERLATTLAEGDPARADLPGADNALDAVAVVDRALQTVLPLLRADDGLRVIGHDEHGVVVERLLPWRLSPAPLEPPLTLEPPVRVAAGVGEQYLYHLLLARVLRSIRLENRQRLLQMDNALRHIEQGRETLQRQRNRLRQEEIVEEIEITAGLRHRASIV